jgi:hypothetical protein
VLTPSDITSQRKGFQIHWHEFLIAVDESQVPGSYNSCGTNFDLILPRKRTARKAKTPISTNKFGPFSVEYP